MGRLGDALSRLFRVILGQRNSSAGVPQTNEDARQDLEAIERETARTVSIETTTSADNLQKCHAQDQSPLFALPAEIRTIILSYTLTPDPWEDSFDAQLFHPTDRFSLGILQTCRRIWLEANSLVFEHAAPELSLYGTNSFGDYHTQDYEATVRGLTELDRFLKKLTPNNIERMRLHVLADYVILGKHASLRKFIVGPDTWPRHVTLTFRFRQYTFDSWIIAQPHPEGMTFDQIMADLLRYGAVVGIRHFVFKMEALVEKREELERSFEGILNRASRGELGQGWRFDREHCQRPRVDDRSGRGHIEIAVVEWHRRDHRDEVLRTARGRFPDEAGVGTHIIGSGPSQHVKAASKSVSEAVCRKWKLQGSLLRLIE